MIYENIKYPDHILEDDINKKILVITGHLSTGGSPQYLYEYIKTVGDIYSEIKVVEFSNFSNDFIIQKDRIRNLIGENNIICLGDINASPEVWYSDKMKLISLIEDYDPDIIWMNEFPENYEYRLPPSDLMEYIYRIDRPYKIIETTHYNAVNFDDKIYIGDEFMFCSPPHIEKSKSIDIKKYLWEVPINLTDRPDRNSTLKSLGVDPNYIHVLNVGLFHKNKNQKYIFELANKMKHHKVMFHFIGNDCFFNECGMTEDELRLDNYRIWGERSDVAKFMSCLDIYLFPSIKELNPLTVKEALSNQMEVIVNRDGYISQYREYENFHIIDEINVIEHIKNKIQEIIMEDIDNTQDELNKIIIHDFDGIKVEVLGHINKKYNIEFIDGDTNDIIYSTTISNNMWTQPDARYFVNWKIKLNSHVIYEQDLKGKNILIEFGSSSLGDTIAWFPYILDFKTKHECEITIMTYKNWLFKGLDIYKDITFIEPNEKYSNIYKKYNVGWYYNGDDITMNKKLCPLDFKTIPLQQTMTEILGIDHYQLRPTINMEYSKKPPIANKYVCIAIHSTAQAKYWNNPNGWQDTVNYLNGLGYDVILVSKEEDGYMGNKHPDGIKHVNGNLQEISNYIKHADFFIGVSSGLSWLAWAIGTPIVLISGFTKTYTEFNGDDIIRIINTDAGHGCFNKYRLDPNDWNWCPIHKGTDRQFECSKEISSKQVIEGIDKIIEYIKKAKY